MMTRGATVPFVPQIRRILDLGGAAAIGAALMHNAFAVARGWPRASWIDAATSNVVLGVFGLLLVLYAARWFYPDETMARRASASGASRRSRLGPLVRASGEATAAAMAVGLIVALLGRSGAAEEAVRGYYVATAVIVVARWIAERRRS